MTIEKATQYHIEKPVSYILKLLGAPEEASIQLANGIVSVCWVTKHAPVDGPWRQGAGETLLPCK